MEGQNPPKTAICVSIMEVTGPSYRAEQTKQQLAAQRRSKPSPKQGGRTE